MKSAKPTDKPDSMHWGLPPTWTVLRMGCSPCRVSRKSSSSLCEFASVFCRASHR